MEAERTCKTVLLGDSSVGKSSVAVRLARDVFTEASKPTIGASFFSYAVAGDAAAGRDAVKYEIWDTAGQERYRALAPMYYRGAQVVLLVYDVCERESFGAVKSWMQDVRTANPGKCVLVLLGNKCDIEQRGERGVSRAEGEVFAEENAIEVFQEVSAKTGANVREVLLHVASLLPAVQDDGDDAPRKPRVIDQAAAPAAGCGSSC